MSLVFILVIFVLFRVYDVVRETMHSAISASKTGVLDITLTDFQEVNYLHIAS